MCKENCSTCWHWSGRTLRAFVVQVLCVWRAGLWLGRCCQPESLAYTQLTYELDKCRVYEAEKET